MNTKHQDIENLVISHQFGLGQIMGTEQIGGDELYSIQSVEKQIKIRFVLIEKYCCKGVQVKKLVIIGCNNVCYYQYQQQY